MTDKKGNHTNRFNNPVYTHRRKIMCLLFPVLVARMILDSEVKGGSLTLRGKLLFIIPCVWILASYCCYAQWKEPRQFQEVIPTPGRESESQDNPQAMGMIDPPGSR